MRKKIAPTRKLRGRATGKEDSKAIPSVKVGPSEEPGEVTTDANANQSSDPYGTSALDPEGATSASPGGGDKVENPLARKSEGVQVSNKEGVSYSEVGGIKGGCTSIHNEKQEGTDAIAKKKQGKPNARKKSDGLGEGHSNKTCAKSEPAEEETDACGRAVANNNVSSANQPEEPEGTSALSGHEHEVGDQQGVDSAKEFGRKTSEVDDNKYSDELERSVKEPAHEKAVESTKNATAEQLAEPEGNSTFSGRHEAGNQERLTNVGEFCERTSAKDEVSCSEAGGITAGSAIIQDEQEGRADALIKTKQGRMKAASPDNPHSDDENPESEADLRGHGKSEKDTWGSKRKRSRSKNTLEAEARAKASFGSGNESDEKRRSDERPDRYNANDMKARKMKDSSSHKRSTPVSRTADEMHDDATEPGDRGIAHRESAEKEKAEPSLRKASSEVAYGVDLGDRNVGGKGQKGDQEEGGLPGKEPKPSEKPLSKLSISAGDADLPLSTADAPAPGRNRSRLSIEPAKATDASTSSDYPVGSLLWAREVSINPLWPAVVYDPAYVPTRTLRELKRPQSSKIFWLGHKLFSNMPQENKRGKPYRVPANPQKDEQLCAAARNQYKREPPELALLDDAMKQLKELEKYNAQDMQAWMCEESKRMDGWTPEDFLQAHADWMAEDPDGMKAYMDDKFQREDEEESESQSEQSVDSSKGEPLPAKAKVPKSSKRRRPPADESEGEEEEGVLPANSKVPKSSKRKRSPADASEGEEEEVLPAKSKVPKSSKRGRTPMHSRESEGEIWAAKSKALKSSKPKRTRSDSDESEGETWSAKVQVPKSSKSKPTRRRATAPKRVRSDGITLELGPPIATPKSDYDLAYLKDAKPAVLRKVLKKLVDEPVPPRAMLIEWQTAKSLKALKKVPQPKDILLLISDVLKKWKEAFRESANEPPNAADSAAKVTSPVPAPAAAASAPLAPPPLSPPPVAVVADAKPPATPAAVPIVDVLAMEEAEERAAAAAAATDKEVEGDFARMRGIRMLRYVMGEDKIHASEIEAAIFKAVGNSGMEYCNRVRVGAILMKEPRTGSTLLSKVKRGLIKCSDFAHQSAVDIRAKCRQL